MISTIASAKSEPGLTAGLSDILEANDFPGSPTLLIDTIDIVLSSVTTRYFDQLLAAFTEAGSSIVITCRPQEYGEYLKPTSKQLPSLAGSPLEFRIPALTPDEITVLARQYLQSLSIVPPRGQEEFSQSIVNLESSQRSLSEIVQSPLLLGMVCELYGPGGSVPPDLDVGRLYREYWTEKVARTRDGDVGSLASDKEHLALNMARQLWFKSSDGIVEWLQTDTLTENAQQVAAFRDLTSEGVLVRSPRNNSAVRFMHQTFTEFAMAKWLNSEGGSATFESAIELISSSGADKLHWWPVMRETFALKAASGSLMRVAQMLSETGLPAFKGLAFGAASGDFKVLQMLTARAVEPCEDEALSAARRQALRDAFATADAEAAPAILRLALSLLEYSSMQEAASNAKSCGYLLAKCGHDRERDALFDSSVRVLSQLRQHAVSSGNAAQVDNVIARFMSALDSSGWIHTAATLRLLRENMGKWDGNAYRAAVSAHDRESTSRYDQHMLGLSVMRGNLTQPPRDAVVQAIVLARPWFSNADDGTDDAVLSFLNDMSFNRSVVNIRASAVGIFASGRHSLLDKLVLLATSDDENAIRRSYVALRAACGEGASNDIADIISEILHRQRLSNSALAIICGLIIDELGAQCSGNSRATLRLRLGDVIRGRPHDRALTALSCLADEEISAWELLSANCLTLRKFAEFVQSPTLPTACPSVSLQRW